MFWENVICLLIILSVDGIPAGADADTAAGSDAAAAAAPVYLPKHTGWSSISAAMSASVPAGIPSTEGMNSHSPQEGTMQGQHNCCIGPYTNLVQYDLTQLINRLL